MTRVPFLSSLGRVHLEISAERETSHSSWLHFSENKWIWSYWLRLNGNLYLSTFRFYYKLRRKGSRYIEKNKTREVSAIYKYVYDSKRDLRFVMKIAHVDDLMVALDALESVDIDEWRGNLSLKLLAECSAKWSLFVVGCCNSLIDHRIVKQNIYCKFFNSVRNSFFKILDELIMLIEFQF